MNWLSYAFLSAIFAALTSVFAKIGIQKEISSNLITAIRSIVIVFLAWAIVFYEQSQKELTGISKYSYIFIILSAVTTGISWLFYFKAIQIGEVSKVAPIDKLSLVFTIILAVLLLKEKLTWSSAIGAGLMAIGAVIIGLGK